jgi:hypothetical protein
MISMRIKVIIFDCFKTSKKIPKESVLGAIPQTHPCVGKSTVFKIYIGDLHRK